MILEDIDDIERAEETYWWHLGRSAIVEEQLRHWLPEERSRRILNVGCGTGGLVPLFRRWGQVTNVDRSEHALRRAQEKGAENLLQADAAKLPFRDGSYDAVFALDVLEHLPDDAAALREWHRVLSAGGALFLTAPAYQWLWSYHDERLQHYRRYRASSLHQLLNSCGYRVVGRTYAITLVFPVIVLVRLCESIFRIRRSSSYLSVPPIVNRALIGLLKIEARILSRVDFPFGTSVVIRAIRA
ncbi:MAG: class I SAM-dependent methyltransferase [Bdellovibrionales bacterium]|nr:class I SAM-dependent methyltransferase [Bdellovibrionales bacterium]